MLKISKKQILAFPKFTFDGKIVLVDKVKQVSVACKHLQSFKYCGIDSEREPSFVKGEQNPISLLQLSTPDRVVYLFHLLKIGFPQALIELVENKKLLKVGIALRDDRDFLIKLKKHSPSSYIELSKITTGKLDILNTGARALSALLLGIQISKKMQKSNWGRKQLSKEQLEYAATDAWLCSEIFARILEKKIINLNNVDDYLV